ncbi:gluconokinase [Flammeovirgaceae bacterium SG7u.111]|nr:gluconokinase [Flammeovirgaceae bacterium SG7u.132]WPO35811.1 gluconokinase [Flammeovirgaceae bacterium SG7u.111]
MKKEYIIGLDLGTTSVKSLAYSLDGKVLKVANVPISTHRPSQQISEQVPDEVLSAVIKSLCEVAEGRQPMAISVSSAMHSIIAVDKDGKLLTNAIIWSDTRSIQEAEEIKKSANGHVIYKNTGTPIHPMSPLAKLVWLKKNEPEIHQNAFRFLSLKEYILFKFFGEYVVDHSIASASGLFNNSTLQWDEIALEIAGITSERLSRPVPSTFQLKGLRQEYADAIGIGKTTPFVVGASDGCLANLGANAMKKGEASVTIGTSGAIRVASSAPIADDQERLFSYVLNEHHFISGGPINNGGIALQWFCQSVLQFVEKPMDKAMELAASVEPGANGLVFLPYLLGERAPIWDGAAKSAFVGLTFNHTIAHMARAVLEGVAFSIKHVAEALEENVGKLDVVYASGGFANSDLWVQILADVLGAKINITESHENSAIGAAILGLYALGNISDLSNLSDLVKVSREFNPNPTFREKYSKNFEVYRGLYGKLKDDFHSI